MIPFVNVIVGILIGVFNDSWVARLAIPFLWGLVFCLYVTIAQSGRRHAFIAAKQGQKAKWGMSPFQAFYFIEYMTAVSTSLPVALLSGWIKQLF